MVAYARAQPVTNKKQLRARFDDRGDRIAIRVGDPVSMAVPRVAQEGRDPSGAALAVPDPAAAPAMAPAPAMVLADGSDPRDRSPVWESVSSAHPEELNTTSAAT